MDIKQKLEDDIALEDRLGPIEVIEYNYKSHKSYTMEITEDFNFSELADIPEGSVRWINITGQFTANILENLGKGFNIHPLVLENIYEKNERAKIVEYKDFLYIVTKMLYYSDEELVIEHINFILGPDYVITIGEHKGDVFDGIRNLIKSSGASVRKFASDYLLYLLLDAIVEGSFDILEIIRDEIDDLEEQIMTETSQDHLHDIREIKKTLLKLNKYIRPLKDIAFLLGKEATDLIKVATEPYIRDVYNHVVQAVDSIEISRESLSSLTDLHISNTSYKLNEIIKVLTIISTIFIPLTFIFGVYGMNFKYIPEITSRWGYGITWIVMLTISASMIYYFKKKKWF